MGGFFLGFIGGVFAWIVTALVGQPIYHFISLRAEAARVLARYERSMLAPAPRRPTRIGLWNANALTKSAVAASSHSQRPMSS
jgi:hypothetical protein